MKKCAITRRAVSIDDQRILHHLRIFDAGQRPDFQNAPDTPRPLDVTLRVFQLAGGRFATPARHDGKRRAEGRRNWHIRRNRIGLTDPRWLPAGFNGDVAVELNGSAPCRPRLFSLMGIHCIARFTQALAFPRWIPVILFLTTASQYYYQKQTILISRHLSL